MKKKVLALVLVVALVAALTVGLVACGNDPDEGVNEVFMKELDGIEKPDYSTLDIPSTFKIGLICLHDKNSTYDKNFIEAMERTQAELGLSDEQVLISTGIGETTDCKTEADKLVREGCKIIFADSFGHESFMLDAAKAHPEVQFCHATGVQAHTAGVANFHNAFASIYEGRYLAGVAAGLKLNEMAGGVATGANAKMGYVGAFTYAEVISGYTSFFLGAKSVCPDVTMDVKFTGSWYDETAERQTAESLIQGGCKLISQHADSMGAPNACEAAGVPNVSYNGSTINACSDTFIISSKINWTPYYNYCISQFIKGEPIVTDYVGTLKTGSVQLSGINADVMAAGTVEKLEEARAELVAGTRQVFDLSKFTVDEEELTTFPVGGVDVVKELNGVKYIAESNPEVQAAPYFGIQAIDGIKCLNTNFGKKD